MMPARNVREARAIEIAEHRTEQLCMQLDSFRKSMKIARAAVARSSKAIEEVRGLEDEDEEEATMQQEID